MTTPAHDPYRYSSGGVATVSDSDRSMALVAHLATLAAMVVSVGWLSFVGPLVVWMLYKDKSAFVRQAAAGAFNFNIGMWIASVIGWVLTFTVVFAVVGIPLIVLSFLAQLFFHILGAVRASRGQAYTYPFQLRILS